MAKKTKDLTNEGTETTVMTVEQLEGAELANGPGVAVADFSDGPLTVATPLTAGLLRAVAIIGEQRQHWHVDANASVILGALVKALEAEAGA